jgi:hypothetical protein
MTHNIRTDNEFIHVNNTLFRVAWQRFHKTCQKGFNNSIQHILPELTVAFPPGYLGLKIMYYMFKLMMITCFRLTMEQRG